MDLSKESIQELLATGAHQVQPFEHNGRMYKTTPPNYNYSYYDLEPTLDIPKRARASVLFTETGSLIEYLAAFADEGTRVFCDRTAGAFLAVLDYHKTEDGGQRWGEHRARLQLQKTVEWKTFLEKNKQVMTQAAFAEFLEDQTPWIVQPSGAELLEIALNLEQSSKVQFKSQVRLADGRRSFTYQDNDTTNNVKVPEIFELSIAPFDGMDAVSVRARLRFRVDGGALKFFYVLINPEMVERRAVESAVEQIEEGEPEGGVPIKVLSGSLEKMGLA